MNDDDIEGVVLITLSRGNVGSSMSVPVPPDVCDAIAETGNSSYIYHWADEEYPDWEVLNGTCEYIEMWEFMDRLRVVGCPHV